MENPKIENHVVKVPAPPIHPRLIEKAERQQQELAELLPPEARRKLEDETARFVLGASRDGP